MNPQPLVRLARLGKWQRSAPSFPILSLTVNWLAAVCISATERFSANEMGAHGLVVFFQAKGHPKSKLL